MKSMPMRGTFFGCCASAGKQSAKRSAARTSVVILFFINCPHPGPPRGRGELGTEADTPAFGKSRAKTRRRQVRNYFFFAYFALFAFKNSYAKIFATLVSFALNLCSVWGCGFAALCIT